MQVVDEWPVDIRLVGIWLSMEVCLLDEWLVDMWLEDVLVLESMRRFWSMSCGCQCLTRISYKVSWWLMV